MTDIEQQFAKATETRKSTAILADPEHVTEPLQILPFVISFFRSYTDVNRTKYEKIYNEATYKFAKMLIGFTDPPNFGAIMSNGDYFLYWSQSNTRLKMWFEVLQGSMSEKTDEGFWEGLLKHFKDKPSTKDTAHENVVARVITGMFQSVDKKYREFQHALIEAEEAAIASLDKVTATIKTLDRDKALNDRDWADRMDEFLRKKQTKTESGSDIAASVGQFVIDVLQSAPFFVGAPMPIGMQPGAINTDPRPIAIGARPTRAVKVTKQPTLSTPSTRATPETDTAAAARVVKETTEATNNSIIEHYRQITADFGAYMLELFRSFNFPPVFSLDEKPAFTVEWDGYIKLAYNSFNQLAAQRAAYLYRKGEADSDVPPQWKEEEIYADDTAAALFAEFVGYKKAVPQSTVAPAPNVQRTNATYHYAINNMSLRFVSLYNYMAEKGKHKKRRTSRGVF